MIILGTALLLLPLQEAHGQEYVDGVEVIYLYRGMAMPKSSAAPWPTGITSRRVRYFPVQHHVVRESNGSTTLPPGTTDALVDNLNTHFSDSITFYSCPSTNFINSTHYYNNYHCSEEEVLRDAHNVEGVINLYYFNAMTCLNGEIWGYTYLPWWGDINFIALRNSNAPTRATPVHEFGHFFGLPHTFEIWWGREQANGSDCADDGDRFCDTPADYRESRGSVNINCIYTGATVDEIGTRYSPDPRNFMTYPSSNNPACRNRFTAQQHSCMVGWANHSSRLAFNRATVIENQTISGSRSYSNGQTCGIVVLRSATIASDGHVTVSQPQAGTLLDKGFQVEVGGSLTFR